MTNSFQCDICGTSVISKHLLVKHIDKHRNLPKCNVCGKNYKSLNNLKYHLKIHFDDENYFIICYLCGKPVSKWKLRRHIERHNPKETGNIVQDEKTFSCRYCGLTFNKINNRTSHEKRIHLTKSNLGLENFKCIDCSSIFRTKEELRDHSFEHFTGKIHFCDYPGCTRYFKKGKLVTVHKRCHFEPQFKCIDCGAKFVQKSGLSKHKKERCSVRKPNSEADNKAFEKTAKIAKQQFLELNGRLKSASKKVIRKHIAQSEISLPKKEVVEPKSNKEIKTESLTEDWHYEFLDEALLDEKSIESSQIFADRININVDEVQQKSSSDYEDEKTDNKVSLIISEAAPRDDDKEKEFSCDICGKSGIRTKSGLQGHLKSHTKVKKEDSCHIQDYNNAFLTKSQLVKHKVSIHRSKPFICDYCGKEYWTRSSIVTHLLVTHKTVADFNCQQCCRKFKSHGNLSRHIRSVHSGEKQFGCEKCGAMFNEKYQLEIHIHNHDEPTKCSLCGKMVSNIKVHLRHHASKSNNTTVKCPMCDKMIGKYQLMRHIKSVHEKQYQPDSNKLSVKVYTCKDCGDYFSRRQELRQHEYINHSQSKIYECNICGTYFKKLKLLNVHRFSHQPLNVACEICNKVYARRGALWKHQKKSHPELVFKKKR